MSTKRIGKYEIGRTLGSGASCKVKLGLDTETGRKVAVKIMNKDLDKDTMKLVMTEVDALKNIDQHVNVIHLHEFGDGKYEKHGKPTRDVSYIVLEIAQGGELFDFVALSGRFPEPLARHYFKEFMSGLDHCHQKGISHRDLKPENLMLDNQFFLKIADFGFAAPVEGRDGSGNLHTKLGTLNYMAPEIHLKQAYNGKSVDLFAAAIILFIMVAQHPPFTTAQPTDPFYRCIAANRADIFWKTHCKNKPNGLEFFSDEFKDLIQSMLQLDPSHRPSMAEVMAHPWMNGDTPDKQLVQNEFVTRQQAVTKSVESERQEKENEKAKRVNARKSNAITRGVADSEELKEGDLAPTKQLLPYEKVFKQNTEFFSTCNPDDIEQALVEHLRNKEKIEPVINKDKYKIKFSLETKGQDENVQNTSIVVRILKVDDKSYCVEFTKTNGNNVLFHEHFNNISKNSLNFANDTVAAI